MSSQDDPAEGVELMAAMQAVAVRNARTILTSRAPA